MVKRFVPGGVLGRKLMRDIWARKLSTVVILLIVMAGVIIYVLLAYWLTGRVDGPTIPVLRMDLVAFLIFLAILSSVGMMSQFYFSKPDGEATFQGDGVTLKFPFRGKIAEEQIYEVLNATFAARQSIMGWTGTGYARPGLDRPNQ